MSEQQIPSRLVFRVPQVSILAALLVAICATPIAVAIPVLSVVYLLPLAAIVWIVRVRTVADGSGLIVRALGTTELPWGDLKGLLLSPKGTVTALRADDTRVPLPSVRTRHLPALALISGGRITDPTVSPEGNGDNPVDPVGTASDGRSSDDRPAEKSESEKSDAVATETRPAAE